MRVKGKDKEGSSHGRADYAFHIAPNFRDPRFFAEAKKPHGDIATKGNYLQTIGYGLSSSTPLAVLTDFEQFEILDCRYKPDIANPLSHCIRKFRYPDYAAGINMPSCPCQTRARAFDTSSESRHRSSTGRIRS